MSHFIKIHFLAFILLFLFAGLNVVVDPYGIFPYMKRLGLDWVKPEMVHSVKLHKAWRLDQVNAQTIVMGTSRSAIGIDPDYPGWPADNKTIYNAALTGAGMYVTRRFLEHANKLNSLEQLVLGLDFFAFNVHRQRAPDYRGDFLIVNDDGTDNRHFDFKILGAALVSTEAYEASMKTVKSTSRHALQISDNGMIVGPVWKKNIQKSFNNMESLYFKHVYLAGQKRQYAFINQETGKSSLEEFRRIVRICQENNIELKLFISPVHARHLEVIRALGIWPLFEQWKIELLRILEEEQYKLPLWDFSGYNSITTDDIKQDKDYLYRDSTHYGPQVGNMILSRVFAVQDENLSIDFGVQLTKENIAEHLHMTLQQQKKYALDFPEDVAEIESLAVKNNFAPDQLVLKLDGAHSKARRFRPENLNKPISKALQDYERGMLMSELIDKHGISEKVFWEWKKKFDRSM